MTTTPARRPVRKLDLIAGILMAAVGGLIGLLVLALLAQVGRLPTDCAGCSAGYLSGMVILGTAIVVFGWFVTTGLFIVRILRRQLAFWLPIVGIVVIFAAFYLVAFLVRAYGS